MGDPSISAFAPRWPPGNNTERERFLPIETQILKVSRDNDVDAIVTGIDPTDITILRAGRPWRHIDRVDRPALHPELLILSSEPTNNADANWYDAVSKRAKWLYRLNGIVWRSLAKRCFRTAASERLMTSLVL
jgi:CRISPR-associated endonuclease/helicase Cas3